MGIQKEFAFHTPSEKGKEVMTKYRLRFSDLLEDIRRDVENSRELSIVIHHLEDANTWLNKAINRSDPNAVMQG